MATTSCSPLRPADLEKDASHNGRGVALWSCRYHKPRPRSREGSQSCVCWYHRNSLRLKLDAASALQMKMNPSNTQADLLPRAHHPHTRSCSEVIHSPTTQKEEMISPETPARAVRLSLVCLPVDGLGKRLEQGHF